MKAKALLLYSGGLDSQLAARVLMEQGVEVTLLHFILPFFSSKITECELFPSKIVEIWNVTIKTIRCGDDYIAMLKNPSHGYGKNMNPCIDCKIHFLKKAAEIMKEEGYDFIATGEVLGQRPMTQRRDMIRHIEKESGLVGKIVRPLSSRFFTPTDAEESGLIDRSKLFSMNGRGRQQQFLLAEKYSIKEYSSPAGGCLFTDRYYSEKLRDILLHHDKVNADDLYLLTIGRHIRLNQKLKIIVGRNSDENIVLKQFAGSSDIYAEPFAVGPSIFGKGSIDDNTPEYLAKILFSYMKNDQTDFRIKVLSNDFEKVIIPIERIKRSELLKYYIVK